MKLRNLGFWLVALALTLPAAAAGKPGSISGYVRNSAGTPQMGAAVEIFSSASRSVTVFTDGRGFYSLSNLLPGVYQLKVSAPSFLPSLRENVALRTGANALVNVTLNTLWEAVQMKPRRRSAEDDDDWKWTLRSTAGRPILRVLEDGPPLVVVSKSNRADDRVLKARVAFVAGSDSDGFGGSNDLRTSFSLQRSLFTSGTISVNGNVGYNSGSPAATLRAAYSREMASGSRPQVALTVRRFASPDNVQRNAALQALALSLSDSVTLADVLELNLGSEVQTVQFMGRVTAFRPFGSVDLHLSPDTVLEYRYATSQPNTRLIKGFDSAPADLSESGPRMSVTAWQPALERAHHHEISLSRRMGKNKVQVAAYSDRISNAALTGVGDVSAEDGEVLPDVYSSSFTYNGGQLHSNGLRVVAQRKFSPQLTTTVDYAYGGVLDLDQPNPNWNEVRASLRTSLRHAVAGKISGTLPGSRTNWITSYRWTSGQAITPVDMFNASAGQADPYWSLFLRQPLPALNFLPARMEALIDVRNLLAQGYVPVIGEDGHTLYLVQAARSIRGGVAFTF